MGHHADYAGVVFPFPDLPQSSDSGPHDATHSSNFWIRLHHVKHQRAWTDQAHIPLQHIEQLRQFVDAGFADERADGRQAGIFV